MAIAIVLLRHGTFPRALPLIVVTALVAEIVLFVRVRSDRERALRLISLIMWSAFGLVLLAKMGLNTRLVQYGFYLALPAMVVAITLTSSLIPQVLASWKSEAVARGFRQIALWTLAAAIAPYLGLAHGWYRTKTIAIGAGADRFYASSMSGQWQGAAVQDALRALKESAHPGAILAVLPEGVMINYLLRLDSPLRIVNPMPPELMAFGEDDVLRSLMAKPPDFVLLIEKDTSEYGYPPFGSDPRYGLTTLAWIHQRYETVRVIRKDPGRESEAVMRLMSRRKE